VKPIYAAVSVNTAPSALDELAEKWGTKHAAIIRLWNDTWQESTPFLHYGAGPVTFERAAQK